MHARVNVDLLPELRHMCHGTLELSQYDASSLVEVLEDLHAGLRPEGRVRVRQVRVGPDQGRFLSSSGAPRNVRDHPRALWPWL